ncbi:hypothetical protein [Rhodococcus sp. X156]|uniref:hypothetical protein n=1 Tax=Rhodococcus sp. X156 TaxID=2499145 RepID=UPI000FD70C1B|nr:hypothetical protein [Rhodococcus sp. X156]
MTFSLSIPSLSRTHAPDTARVGLVARLRRVDVARWFTPAAPLVGPVGGDRDAQRLHRDLQAARDHAEGGWPR